MNCPQGILMQANELDGRNDLIEQFRFYVVKIVSRLMVVMGLPSEWREDFVAAGYLGLVEAASRFDKNCGVDFRTYAFHRVRGAVIDSVRRSCSVSSRAYRILRHLEAASDIRSVELSGPKNVSDEERLAHIVDYLSQSAFAYRLQGVINSPPLEEREISDPEQDYIKGEKEIRIRAVLEELPKLERDIIRQHYFEGKRFSEIAESMPGTSRSWISRLHSRGLKRLKELYLAKDGQEGV